MLLQPFQATTKPSRSRRPDGTRRRQLRVRPGWVPLEERSADPLALLAALDDADLKVRQLPLVGAAHAEAVCCTKDGAPPRGGCPCSQHGGYVALCFAERSSLGSGRGGLGGELLSPTCSPDKAASNVKFTG